MEIEVTAALLRAMNGCAATELGQVVWVKLESAARGSLVGIDPQEARFIHGWIAESITVATAMTEDAGKHGLPGEARQLTRELTALRRVQALLPAGRARR
jgi:hypothetical protein